MLLWLIVASLLVMGSPGPSTISVTAVGAAFGLHRSIAYLAGLIAGTIANPKAYVAIAAVFAASMLDTWTKVAVLSAMILLIHLAWLLAGAVLARVFRDPVWSRRVNRVFAAALVVTTVYAAL